MKPWWIDLVDELPTEDAMRAATDALMTEVTGWLREIDAELAAPRSILTAREAIEEWIREEQTEHKAAVVTGWGDLDAHLQRPMRAGELVLVAARAGVGKTWALQSWIEASLSLDLASAVVIFELEMLAWQLAERLAAHALRIAPRDARAAAERGSITAEDVLQAAPSLERLAINESLVSVEQLPQAIAQAGERLGQRPTIVCVDYLGLLRWDGGVGARTYERASENAKRLKSVARSERVVIVAAAQMSRGAGDGSSKPTLDDLRDSGVVEEAADRVIALWRPTAIEDEDAPQQLAGVELSGKVLKNRFGPTGGEFDLQYDDALRLGRPTYAPDRFPFDP